jgi:hypothetical protein
MGIIANLLGLGGSAGQIGGAVERVAEVFVPNKTKAGAQQHAEFTAALAQFGTEFQQASSGIFDSFVNGLNRLPRPVMALGTVAMFVYAMWDPAGFSTRMQGLAHVPDPLWWLLGAVVSFYFGARELHYLRDGRRAMQAMALPAAAARAIASPVAVAGEAAASDSSQHGNAALADWYRSRSDSG